MYSNHYIFEELQLIIGFVILTIPNLQFERNKQSNNEYWLNYRDRVICNDMHKKKQFN